MGTQGIDSWHSPSKIKISGRYLTCIQIKLQLVLQLLLIVKEGREDAQVGNQAEKTEFVIERKVH